MVVLIALVWKVTVTHSSLSSKFEKRVTPPSSSDYYLRRPDQAIVEAFAKGRHDELVCDPPIVGRKKFVGIKRTFQLCCYYSDYIPTSLSKMYFLSNPFF